MRAEDRDFVYGGLNVAGGVFIVRGTATDGRHLWITNTTSHAHAFRLFDDPETPEDEYGRPDTSRKLTIPRQRPAEGPLHRRADDVGRQIRLERRLGAERETVRRNRCGVRLSAPRGQRPRLRHLVERETFYVVDADDDMIYTYRGISGVVRPFVEDAETAAALVGNTGQSVDAGHDLGSAGAKRAQAFTTGISKAGYALASVGIGFGEVSDTSSAPSDLEVTLNTDGRRRPWRRSLHADRPGEPVGAEREHLRRSGLGDDLPGSRERDDLLRGRRKGPRHRLRRHRRQWNGERLRRCRSRGGVFIADGSATYSPHDAAQGWASDTFSYKIEVRGSFIKQPGQRPGDGHGHAAGEADARRGGLRGVGRRRADPGRPTRTSGCGSTGATESNIGSGSSTYTLVAEDLGKRIKVRVAFVDDRGNYETLTSEATAAVEVFKAEDQPGTVSLFPARPRIGTVLSASLSDPDGLEGGGSGPAASSGAVSWSWAKSSTEPPGPASRPTAKETATFQPKKTKGCCSKPRRRTPTGTAQASPVRLFRPPPWAPANRVRN